MGCKELTEDDTSQSESTTSGRTEPCSFDNEMTRVRNRGSKEIGFSTSGTEEDETEPKNESDELFVSTPRNAEFQKKSQVCLAFKKINIIDRKEVIIRYYDSVIYP